jgi:hypothetical protein
MTALFIWIQGFAIIVIPFIFLAEKKHRTKQKEVMKF